MRAYHQTELDDFVTYADEQLRGAQLQDVLTYPSSLVLQFYLRGKGDRYLVVDLDSKAPMMLLFEQNPLGKSKVKKPLSLFLNSHGKNLFVEDIVLKKEWGRVVRLRLVGEDDRGPRWCQVVVHLIPKAANLLIENHQGKKISWNKPKDLAAVETPEVSEVRSIVSIHREWRERLRKPETVTLASQIKMKLEKDLEKKRRALQEIETSLGSHKSEKWFELGELLKYRSLSELGPEWNEHLDRQESLSWNLERAFQKGKGLEKKKEGTFQRKKILEEEISHLAQNLDQEVARKLESPVVAKKTHQDVKARRMDLPSGAVAFLGKSAQDNLKILRQSQAWDFWLHLKDYPSAHAVIHRNKNQNIPSGELQEVARWLAKESLQKKLLLPGVRLQVIYAECRFVRPIKGDKPGRVNYQNEKSFVLVV